MSDEEAGAWEDALIDLAEQERKMAADAAFLRGGFDERFK